MALSVWATNKNIWYQLTIDSYNNNKGDDVLLIYIHVFVYKQKFKRKP